MCQTCKSYLTTNASFQVNVKAYDPTRTTGLRNAFVKELNKRFSSLISEIRKAVIYDDVFGIEKPKPISVFATPGAKAYQFATSQEKVDQFMKWLQGQVDSGLLETTKIQQIGEATNVAWTNTYIKDSYKRGVIRARNELKNAGFKNIHGIDATGGIELSMNTPFHLDRLGLAYSRTYTDLKGVTDQMGTQISRILAQGLADGDGPSLLGKKIVTAIEGNGAEFGLKGMSAKRRGEILARTEIIRAHHVATIQEYKNWGAEGVHVQAEFTTAGDGRVCPECSALQGKIFDLNQIESMIPVHPQCRCIALPTLPDDDRLVQEVPVEKVEEGIPMSKSAYDYMSKNGWDIQGDNITKGTLDKNFKKEMGNFNIAELDSELNTLANEYGIVWKEKTYQRLNQYNTTLDFKGITAAGDEVQITRVFNFYDNIKTVDHRLFALPDDLQGKGFAKGVLKSFYKQYTKSGIKNIEIYANLDIGGYAWGRYGFQAEVDNVQRILSFYTRNYGEFADEANAIFDTWLKANPDTPYFPMNLLADADFGKDLLLGKSWSGQLDLSDALQRKRFEQYLFSTKKK